MEQTFHVVFMECTKGLCFLRAATPQSDNLCELLPSEELVHAALLHLSAPANMSHLKSDLT